MSSLWAIFLREWIRSTRSGLWYLGASLCYLVHAAYFCLILSNMVGAQPQPISPLRWLLGGDLLLLLALMLPTLLVKAFAEERQQQTYDQLICSGISAWTLVLGKMLALAFNWSAWVFFLSPLAIVIHVWGMVEWGPLILALLGLWAVGLHWLALGLALSCRSQSIIGAFAKSTVGLLLYWALPFLRLVWRDPFYRVVLDSFDFRAVMERTAQGLVLSTDLIFIFGAIPLWLGLAVMRLEWERWSLKNALRRIWMPMGFALVSLLIFYTSLYIAHHRPVQWDISPRTESQLSEAYLALLPQFPNDIEITAVLPRQLNIETYAISRDLILNFLQRSVAHKNSLKLRVLDPDVDQTEMDNLQQQGVQSKNKIGFVHVRRGERQVILSYDQWVSLGTMTLDNEPHRYVRQFHGEALFTRAINTLTRDQRGLRVLALVGFKELDLGSNDRLGGSSFLELFQQLGMQVEALRPGVDEINLENYQLILSLDPRNTPTQAAFDLIAQAREKRIPVLALNSGLSEAQKNTLEWEHYGVQVGAQIIYQLKYSDFDNYTFPVHEFSNHKLMLPLTGQMLLMDHCRPLTEGVPSDPRLVSKPLLRVEKSEAIWGESSARAEEGSVKHSFDATDAPSPLVVGMAVHSLEPKGMLPLLVILGSRSPFENRFFFEAGNRNFAFQCLEWLTGAESTVALPPKPPADFRFRLDLKLLRPLQMGLLFMVPLFLTFLWWWKCRRWR